MLIRLISSFMFLFAILVQSSFAADDLSVVTGQVRFERRFTRVGEILCDGAPCQRSESYWSIVIMSGQSRYLLRDNFNFGSLLAPESVELEGVTLRLGSIIKVEGRVEAAAPNLYELRDIRTVSLVRDLGWFCKNSKEANPKLIARIWYESVDGASGSYKINVQSVKDRAFSPVAFVSHAYFTGQSNEWTYGGQSGSKVIRLGIKQPTSDSASIPASLMISGRFSEATEAFDMRCFRTTLSPGLEE